MRLIAHFIDKNWNFQKKIINLQVLSTPHHGEQIAQAVETCLLGWGHDKIFTITVDNASSDDVAAQHLHKLIRSSGLLLDGEFFSYEMFCSCTGFNCKGRACI